jgi:hypothetical protein
MSNVFDFLPLCRRYSAEGIVIKRPSSSDRRQFLESGLQQQDSGRKGNSNYTHYISYITYNYYINISIYQLY